MNILLTNDDGYSSKGILLLKKKLEKYGNVVICAPYEHMSAKSCSITLGKVKLHKIDEGYFALEGTPADCVEFALTSLNINFDLVISGCNDGFNISYDTMYSGTIGASLQGLKHRIPCFAFSCEHNFEIVDKYFDNVMNFILKNNLSSTEYLLNVNFPLGEVVKDIRLSELYYRKDYTYYIKNDDGSYTPHRNLQDEHPSIDTDVYQVEHGIVSICPLGKTYFNKSYLIELKKRLE